MHRRMFSSFTLLFVLFSLLLLACDLGAVAASKPTAVIASPPSGSQFREGEDVAVQSTSTDSAGVVRVELSVDGNLVRTDPAPSPQVSYPLIQTWKATAGSHTITVRAYNAANVASDPAAISITVVGTSATAVPSPVIPTIPPVPPVATSTTAPIPTAASLASPTATTGAAACVNNSVFVADVTVPDGTVLAAGQPFNKIWRVRNNGTCAWGTGYQYVFVAGEAMAATTIIAVPNTAPGLTADLLIAMVAPTPPGVHFGQWRMKAPNGTLFGNTLNVTINVLGGAPPPPAATATATNIPPPSCPGAPVIAAFTASPGTITAPGSTTLSWGTVTNADSASIDQGIGGIATPGNIVVSPATTTTYTLTASGCGGTATRQVTVTVTGAPPTSTTVVRCSIQSESGEVIKSGGSRAVTQALFVGDDSSNNSYRSFFSFNISDIAGKTLDVGSLNIGAPTVQGNPFGDLAGTLWVGALDYGTLQGSDYDLSGTAIANITSGPSGQYNIKSAIQSAVSASKSRFQIRFHMASETNNDNGADLFNWATNNNICLTLTYH